MIPAALIRFYRNLVAKKSIGLFTVLGLLSVSILGNAACFYIFDKPVNEGIGVGDALWYSVVSVTTIGYGDYYAQTAGARIGHIVFVVIIGLSAFSVFFGMVIDWVAEAAHIRQRGLGKVMSAQPILIVHFPSAARVRQVIDELRSDPGHRGHEIVLITDQITEAPFPDTDVHFIHGSPLLEETYQRAGIDNARMAIVLARSYDDPNSDALVASAVSVIDDLHSEIHIVAECVDDSHRRLFAAVRCDAIVSGLKIAGNLLVQEVHDPGVSQMIEVITSNLQGTTLFTTAVETAPAPSSSYADLARRLLDADINVLCINRGSETFTTFGGIEPQAGDRVVYVADRRYTWAELMRKAG